MRSSRRLNNDDDDFDTSDLRSQPGLASIFGRPGTSLARSNNYNQNSQNPPKDAVQPTQHTATSTVIIAKTVQSFKMVGTGYESQGRVGAALVSVHLQVGTYCQLLLYRDKQTHICNTKILKGFKYHIQPKNYCTFYDNENTVWSILFDKKSDMIDFNLQVAAIRWKAEGSSSLLQQDLWCPVCDETNSVAAVGDDVDLKYNVAPYSDMSKVSGEMKNMMTVTVEHQTWKPYLIGLQPDSEKVIITHPEMMEALLDPDEEYYPTCILRISVIKVIKPQRIAQVDSLDKARSSSSQDLAQTRSEPSIVQRAAVDDVRSSPQSVKANLISRMAKMGQPLPFKTAAPMPSDSDDTEEDLGRRHRLSHVPPKARPRAQHPAVAQSDAVETIQAASASVSVPVAQPPVSMQWAPAPYMAGNMYQVQSPLESQTQFNMFFSEVRTTNSELRMGLTRLTDKVESLQSKIESSDKQPNQEISSTLERILDNEQQLKAQLLQIMTSLNHSPSSQNIPSGDQAAAGPCQRCVQLDQIQERVRKLETENEYLQTNNAAQRDALFNAKIADKDQLTRIEELKQHLAQEQIRISDLNQTVQELETQRSKLEDEAKAANKLITGLQSTIYEKQTSIDRLESALRVSEGTKLDEVRRNLQEVIISKTAVADHVKEVMNSVFKCVKIQLEPQKTYDASAVQSILATTIKAVTVQYLGNLADDGNPLIESRSSSTLNSEKDYASEHSNGLDGKPSTQSLVLTSSEADGSSQENLITSLVTNQEESGSHCNGNSHLENYPSNTDTLSQTETTSNSGDHAPSSTDDVLLQRPPPLPLFEEDDDENEDDWLA